MISRSAYPRLRSLGVVAFIASSSCGPQPYGAGTSPAGAELASARGRAASAEVRAKTGMSHLPVPRSEDALRASLRRHYPQQLRDRTGAVLLDVEVNARGTVLDVDVVTPPSTDPHPTHRAVISDGESNVRRAMEFRYDPAFDAAAQAALRETRFTPAVRARDDRAVPFRWRMTVVFDPSLAG